MVQEACRSKLPRCADMGPGRPCPALPSQGPTWLPCRAPSLRDMTAEVCPPLLPRCECHGLLSANRLHADTIPQPGGPHSCWPLHRRLAVVPLLDACTTLAATHPKTTNPR